MQVKTNRKTRERIVWLNKGEEGRLLGAADLIETYGAAHLPKDGQSDIMAVGLGVRALVDAAHTAPEKPAPDLKDDPLSGGG